MTAPAMKTTTATVPAVFSSFRRERVDGIMVDLCARVCMLDAKVLKFAAEVIERLYWSAGR